MGRSLMVACVGGWLALVPASGSAEPPSFDRDIRPILAENCYQCHGPDANARKAGLRLDQHAGATRELKSGATAIVAADPDASELIARVESEDRSLLMPPPKSGKTLTMVQKQMLRQWIAQGANWQLHWSYQPLSRPLLPSREQSSWASNPIDRFVLARLDQSGISPSGPADRSTLIRRLTQDLTGLPPTPEEVRSFEHDQLPDAYPRLVDRLLASPRFGERMAVWWLDLVRFADTVGYHSDVDRSIALYRDYVIQALNSNLPHDQFVIEQLAGDLLPNPSFWQKVASAYTMLGMTTEEGGAQPKEYLTKYFADRVRNFGSVWMGATLGCAECHDHKYDPYTQRDFYALGAFFADLRQLGVGTPKPSLELPTPEQERRKATLTRRINEISKTLEAAGQEEKAVLEKERTRLTQQLAQLERGIRKTIIASAGPPRVTRVLSRGDWMDETGEIVTPAVPTFLNPLSSVPGQRPSRLDLARWVVAAENPASARVVVNRLWKLLHGAGLVDSLDDLGAQGERPSHPQLLDWLAIELRDSGWDVKHLVRLMVMSTTYQQSSLPRPDLASVDPLNRLLARQGEFRLEAEFIRDAALSASGLLVEQLGGESVKPYQPPGYWRFLNFPTRDYVASRGRDQYRRGLYTHWQRTLPHPSLLALDAPSREQCTAKRPISNTPQAALALLNDPSFVEAARALAARVLSEPNAEQSQRLERLWRLVLGRAPDPDERAVMADLVDKHRKQLQADPQAVRALLEVGESRPDHSLDPLELAAWTSVARALLNLDETITRN